MELCPCGSGREFSSCCAPIFAGEPAADPLALMRARYTAYVKGEIDFLRISLRPEDREAFDPEYSKKWSEASQWEGLEILRTEGGGPEDTTGIVEFIAHYRIEGYEQKHHEIAHFIRLDGKWYYDYGEVMKPKPIRRETPKISSNDPCPCGSGKKYKKCCGRG